MSPSRGGNIITKTRSMYLHQLRRAFLLRVHPDRFRNRRTASDNDGDGDDGDEICRKQATLVKALSERMSKPDFSSWQQQQNTTTAAAAAAAASKSPPPSHDDNNNNNNDLLYDYVLERRDGSLVRAKIGLDGTVDEILASMASALEESGAASLPLPPPPTTTTASITTNSPLAEASSSQREWFAHGMNGMHFANPNSNAASSSADIIDRRFDVRTNRRRNLVEFLINLDAAEVERRKSFRTDAQAAALRVRKLYQFQAVDATQLGWSSESVVVLLHQLAALHEEHASTKFHVQSFYPLHAVFASSDDCGSSSHHDGITTNTIDEYGGTIRLNPGLTRTQWLETLRLVTPELLHRVRYRRSTLEERTVQAQSQLGCKLQKGHSCSSQDYHAFLERFCSQRMTKAAAEEENEPENSDFSSFAPALEPVTAIVESSQACRRSKVMSNGTIQLGTDMCAATAISACQRLAAAGRDRAAQEKQILEQCHQAVHQLQWRLGLQRVYRTTGSIGLVTHLQFLDCISRIMVDEQRMEELKVYLAGQSLGIAGSGQSCHVADDGSIVIPHDWR